MPAGSFSADSLTHAPEQTLHGFTAVLFGDAKIHLRRRGGGRHARAGGRQRRTGRAGIVPR